MRERRYARALSLMETVKVVPVVSRAWVRASHGPNCEVRKKPLMLGRGSRRGDRRELAELQVRRLTLLTGPRLTYARTKRSHSIFANILRPVVREFVERRESGARSRSCGPSRGDTSRPAPFFQKTGLCPSAADVDLYARFSFRREELVVCLCAKLRTKSGLAASSQAWT